MLTVRLTMLFLAIMFFVSIPVLAEEVPRVSLGGGVQHGAGIGTVKAGGDTINLMASHNDPTNGPGEPSYYGDFEDASGNPDWNGWTHRDLTQPLETFWTVSNYNQPNPANNGAWCGHIDLPSCDGGANDPDGGYGNYWHSILEFRQAVPHTSLGSTVTVTATLIHDSEIGYDYTYLSYLKDGTGWYDLQWWDGEGTVAVSNSVSYLPGEYVEGTDIVVAFRFTSDDAYSDEDCQAPSAGACQVDDINVNIVNGTFEEDYFEDFEHGGVPDDFGLWTPVLLAGVGDFAKIWTGLEDADPCATNYTPQVAFIDDGVVVPGTGGSDCINWCYGPGGYIVSTTGGLAGYPSHIHNAIESPVMAWPPSRSAGDPDPNGASLTFSGYRHEDLTADAPGIFLTWAVRSADTDNSAGHGFQDINYQGWEDRNYVYYGGPEYTRYHQNVTDLMTTGRDSVQVQLAVYQLGWVWGWSGNDGYPAPYFDDVTFKVYPTVGPAISARDVDLAQDSFPERGSIDLDDLGSHSVRFDMAANIAHDFQPWNDPGDSIVVIAASVRHGADLDGPPVLHYLLRPNPVFDPFRTAGMPIAGSTAGEPAPGHGAVPVLDQWAFDLPDTGFLFPGDILHYYIKATDSIGGAGGSSSQASLLPADTTGFSTGFTDPRSYDPLFSLRALPSVTVHKDVYYAYDLLFINDGAAGVNRDRWFQALQSHGLNYPGDYDVYHVNGPSSGVGNGIGGRANADLLSHYSDILYTSGDLGIHTIANGDFEGDPGDDVGALTGWLDLGDRDLFLAGDGLAGDLDQSGAATGLLLNQYMGVTFERSDIRSYIDNQVAPRVNPVYSGSHWDNIFPSDFTWVAYGGCPKINRFDGVYITGTGIRSAEFADPSGYSGAYLFSAVTLNHSGSSRVVSMPLDLGFVGADPGNPSGGYVEFLEHLLCYFEICPVGAAPDGGGLLPIVFGAECYPNPFNPSTTIMYSLPRAGHLTLCVYNVRGQLVKTLIDGERPAGANQVAIWDGTDNLGSSAASGVYFYEVRFGAQVDIGKMTLLK